MGFFGQIGTQIGTNFFGGAEIRYRNTDFAPDLGVLEVTSGPKNRRKIVRRDYVGTIRDARAGLRAYAVDVFAWLPTETDRERAKKLHGGQTVEQLRDGRVKLTWQQLAAIMDAGPPGGNEKWSMLMCRMTRLERHDALAPPVVTRDEGTTRSATQI